MNGALAAGVVLLLVGILLGAATAYDGVALLLILAGAVIAVVGGVLQFSRRP